MRRLCVLVVTVVAMCLGAGQVMAASTGPLVIVGDSYTSAVGADASWLPALYADRGAYQRGTASFQGNSCFRSYNSYGQLTAQVLKVPVVDASCAGAEPRHIIDVPQYPNAGQGVQIASVPANASRIVVGIGGNPAFGAIIMQTISKRFITTADPVYRRALAYYRDEIPAQLVRIYQTLQRRAPQAKVYAVGYPPILPQRSDPATLGECNLFVDGSSIAPLQHLFATLNASVARAAQQAGVKYVDLTLPGSAWTRSRHDMCAPAGQRGAWHFRANIPIDAADLANPQAWLYGMFHPTMLGQRLTSQQVIRALQQ